MAIYEYEQKALTQGVFPVKFTSNFATKEYDENRLKRVFQALENRLDNGTKWEYGRTCELTLKNGLSVKVKEYAPLYDAYEMDFRTDSDIYTVSLPSCKWKSFNNVVATLLLELAGM